MDAENLAASKGLIWTGTTPRIVFLHGFTGRAADICGLANNLSNEILATDLLGHGPLSSDWEPFSLETQLYRLVQQVSSEDILIGYSMGGRIALEAVSRSLCVPKALILLGVSPGLADACVRMERRQTDARRAASLVKDGLGHFLRAWGETPLIRTQVRAGRGLKELMQRGRQRHTSEGLARALDVFGPGTMPHCWDTLSDIQIPTLLAAGVEDGKYCNIHEDMARRIPMSRCVVIEDSGHAPHLENPEQLALHINEFLREVHGMGQSL